MKKTLSIVLLVLLVFLAVACNNETHVHDWQETSRKAATCSEEGYVEKTCSICKDITRETLAKTEHSRSKNASSLNNEDYPDTPLTCMQNGKYFYRCENCGQVYMETVTAETAEENGVTLQHVSKVKAATADADDYKKFGGYITYLEPDSEDYNSAAFSNAGVTDVNKIAKYDSTVTVDKTQFRTKCQTALCASCGKELPGKAQENLKKPVVGDSISAADFEDVYGCWTYTITAKGVGSVLKASGDTLTLNIVLAKNTNDAEKPTVVAYGSTTIDGKTTTKKLDCTGADTGFVTSKEYGARAYRIHVAAASGLDDTNIPSGAYILLSEDADGEYILKIDTDGSSAGNPDTYAGADENAEESIEYNSEHTSHTLTAMKHYGVNYIVSADITAGHTHYLECSGCELDCIETTIATGTTEEWENDKCKTCGAPKAATGWVKLTIKGDSKFNTGETFWIPENTELKIGYSAYQSFAGKKYEMTGYTTLTNLSAASGRYQSWIRLHSWFCVGMYDWIVLLFPLITMSICLISLYFC